MPGEAKSIIYFQILLAHLVRQHPLCLILISSTLEYISLPLLIHLLDTWHEDEVNSHTPSASSSVYPSLFDKDQEVAMDLRGWLEMALSTAPPTSLPLALPSSSKLLDSEMGHALFSSFEALYRTSSRGGPPLGNVNVLSSFPSLGLGSGFLSSALVEVVMEGVEGNGRGIEYIIYKLV